MVTGMSRGPASCFGPDNVAQFQPEKKEEEIKRNNQSNYYEKKNGYLNKINVIEQIQKEKKGFYFIKDSIASNLLPRKAYLLVRLEIDFFLLSHFKETFRYASFNSFTCL